VAADPHDCGSVVENGIRTVPIEKDVTVAGLEETLAERPSDSYNEWVIRDYVVLGIFAMPPYRVSSMRVPPYPEGMPEWLMDQEPVSDFTRVNIDQLRAAFPGLRIFGFSNEGILILQEGGFVPIGHQEIYEPG
jgi:hypothetical protein